MQRDESLSYSRQSLRKATKFVEGDYQGINPREFYRSLKRSLEEIQEGGDFKYTTRGSQESNLEISSEDVGEKTGKVRGRLIAVSDSREIGKGDIEYKPYGPHGAAGIVVGGLILLIGMTGSMILALLGLGAMIAGGYGYFQTETGSFPVDREDVIRTLMNGEVSERTIDEGEETRTDIFANMSVIYAGDAFLKVSTEDIEEMDWTKRRAITKQVKKWYNQLMEEESPQVDIQEGFIAELSSWSNKSLQSDRSSIENLQQQINQDFEQRMEYTEILMKQLPNRTRDELSEHQDTLMEELEDLSEDMEVYVEREGLKRVK